jgi:hypothetical protein
LKKPKPQPPKGAPDGTIWVGGPMPWFAMGIEITADDLDPDQITAHLGVRPTVQHRRGEVVLGKDGTPRPPRKFGRWAVRIESTESDEWDANEAAKLLIAKFAASPSDWCGISERATLRLKLALFFENFNQGFSLEPAVMRWLADRNVTLDIDIYEGDRDPEQPMSSEPEREVPH